MGYVDMDVDMDGKFHIHGRPKDVSSPSSSQKRLLLHIWALHKNVSLLVLFI